jgi:hypothetical protein
MVVNEEIRLSDDLGPALAKTVLCEERAAWEASTGRCAMCAENRHPLNEGRVRGLGRWPDVAFWGLPGPHAGALKGVA